MKRFVFLNLFRKKEQRKYIFFKGLSLKVNVIAQLASELIYTEVAIQHFIHYAHKIQIISLFYK